MRTSYVSKLTRELPPSGIRKFFDIANTTKGVISLGVGEPDFETPWSIREAAIRAIEKSKTTYTSNLGLLELREAISGYLENRFNIKYDPEKQIVVTVGASEGIDLALRTIIDPGDEILVVEPSYVSYKPCIELCGGRVEVIETKAENQFRLTPQELKDHITDKTKALVLPYPNNPTGGIMEKSDLEAIAPILIEHDILVISDEIYAELTYGKRHVSIASIPGMYERTIVLNGFSKAFSMTGWRLGFAAGPEEVIMNMNKIHQYSAICASTISQYAGIEALTNPENFDSVEEMRDVYDKRRRVMVDGFREIGFECFEPLGAFYVFPSIKSTGMKSGEFCEKLLMEENVAVVPGDAFGTSGEGFIRCSYAYSIENIEAALKGIEKFLTKIKK